MVAVTYVGANNTEGLVGSGGSLTTAFPNGIAVGDLLVLAVNAIPQADTPTTVATPSGWTPATSYTLNNTNQRQAMRTFTKVATAADVAATNVAVSPTAAGTSIYVGARTAAFRGGVGITVTFAFTGPNAATVPTIAAKAGDAIYLYRSASLTSSSNSPVYSAPSGFTQIQGGTTNSGYPLSGADYRLVPADATTGGETLNRTQDQASVLVVHGNAAPNAPVLTAPANAASLDRGASITHTWTPSDPDGDAQAGYDLRYRVAGTTSDWTVVSAPTAGTTASHVAPAGRYAGTIEWQVRTYDANSAGPWSTSRTFTALDTTAPTPSNAASQLDPAKLLALVLHGTGRGNLPTYATVDLPSDGPAGRLVYDSTTSQAKVKTSAATATYAALGAQKAQGTYSGTSVNGRAIAVGFAPDLVVVQSSIGHLAVLTRSEASFMQAFYLRSGQSPSSASGEVLTANGFTVNTSLLNDSTWTYAWTAYKFV